MQRGEEMLQCQQPLAPVTFLQAGSLVEPGCLPLTMAYCFCSLKRGVKNIQVEFVRLINYKALVTTAKTHQPA